MDLTSNTEERILCAWAKVILIVGIIVGVCALIAGIVFSIEGETFLYFFLSIIAAALLVAPFILLWAMVRVIAKISLNITDTKGAIYLLSNKVETSLKRDTEKSFHPIANDKTSNTNLSPKTKAQRETPSPKTTVPLVSVLTILDELNKKGGSEADKLCYLMELRDEGRITQEIYDTVIEKIS